MNNVFNNSIKTKILFVLLGIILTLVTWNMVKVQGIAITSSLETEYETVLVCENTDEDHVHTPECYKLVEIEKLEQEKQSENNEKLSELKNETLDKKEQEEIKDKPLSVDSSKQENAVEDDTLKSQEKDAKNKAPVSEELLNDDTSNNEEKNEPNKVNEEEVKVVDEKENIEEKNVNEEVVKVVDEKENIEEKTVNEEVVKVVDEKENIEEKPVNEKTVNNEESKDIENKETDNENTEKKNETQIKNDDKNTLSKVTEKEDAISLRSQPLLGGSGGSSSDFEEDYQYISVKKTFAGINSNQIPSNFAIHMGTYTLQCSEDDANFNEVSEDGLTWDWRIKDVSTGTFAFSESGEEINTYNVSTNVAEGTTVSVRISSIEYVQTAHDTTCSHTDWKVGENFIFIGSMTNKHGTGIVIITEKTLSTAQRKAIEAQIRAEADLPQGPVHQGPYYFFSIEHQSEDFGLPNGTVQFRQRSDGSYCIFSDTDMWQQIIRGYLDIDPGQSADIEIVNTYTPETTVVEGTKTWNDEDDRDGIRPDSITIRLFANGEEVKNAVVTEADSWKYKFTDIPKYENGSLITYTVKEDPVAGYTTTKNGYNFTNTHIPTADITINKLSNSNSILGGAVFKIHLKSDTSVTQTIADLAEATATYTVVDGNEDGKITFSNLKYSTNDSTPEYIYILTEIEAPTGYYKLETPVEFYVKYDNANKKDVVVIKNLAEVSKYVTASNNEITVKDMPCVTMPEAGGEGTYKYYAIGAFLILNATITLCYRKIKSNNVN